MKCFEFYCGFFKIGTPAFCNESIVCLIKSEMEKKKKNFIKKIINKYIEKEERMLCFNNI